MGRKKVIDKSIDPNDVEPGDLTEITEKLSDEVDSLEEEEANKTLPDEASLQDATNMDENTFTAESVEVGADVDEVLPSELRVFSDNATAKELNRNLGTEVIEPEESEIATEVFDSKEIEDQKEKKVSTKAPKIRSKRYLATLDKIEKDKIYTLDEALELVKSTSTTKFDATVEAHIQLDNKKQKGKATESIRGIVKLPGGPVKLPKVVILDEELVEKILKTGKVDFDIALARPSEMAKIARVAKILGPKGKMPNPKVGTVTDDPEKTKKEIEAGQVEYRADSFNIIHLGIGKISWESNKIKDNFHSLLNVLNKYKIKAINLTSSMGPSVKVTIS